MRTSLADMATEHLAPTREQDDLVPTVLGAVFVQSITWWLEHDRPCGSREMAARSAGLAGALIAEANRPAGP